MFRSRSSDSSSSSSSNPNTSGPYSCPYCHDKKPSDSLFGFLTECPHCSGGSPVAGSSFFSRSDDEEGYRPGDFIRGFIKGMTQVQHDHSESDDEEFDWRRETYLEGPREEYVPKLLKPKERSKIRKAAILQETQNVVEQANVEEGARREEPPTEDLQPENVESEVNSEEKQKKAREEEEATCKFCLQRFDSSDQAISMTDCGHNLHTQCMDTYLPNRKKCPVCNHPLDWTDGTKECVFCLEPFRGWEKVNILDCGHDCHLECSRQLTAGTNCPKCELTYYWTGVQCAICLENISHVESTKKLLCQHEFHVGCLSSWLQRHTTCPLCRMLVHR